MGERQEACERLLDGIEEAIASLERGKDECGLNEWDLFAPEDLEEIIERLRDMASKLHVEITQEEDFSVDD